MDSGRLRPFSKITSYFYTAGSFHWSFTIGGLSMHPMLNIAVRAARAAGTVIVRGFEKYNEVATESKGLNDFVTQVDKEAEQAIIYKIQQSYPEHCFLGEESGEVNGTETDYQWIIDPLDGTTNFVKGIPHFAVSIALLHKGRLDQAVVFDQFAANYLPLAVVKVHSLMVTVFALLSLVI